MKTELYTLITKKQKKRKKKTEIKEEIKEDASTTINMNDRFIKK